MLPLLSTQGHWELIWLSELESFVQVTVEYKNKSLRREWGQLPSWGLCVNPVPYAPTNSRRAEDVCHYRRWHSIS